jgi:hypothetical protein
MENNQALESSIWWYIKDGKNAGPHNESEIYELVQKGKIVRETPVWCTGMQNWCDAGTSQIQKAFEKAASKKTSRVSNRYAWALAIVPFAVYYFVEILLKVINPELSGRSIVFLVYVLLNLVFWWIDSDKLRKSGFRITGWMYSYMWIVPVYLFVRAHKTNGKYGYAICSIIPSVLFLLVFLFRLI